MARLGRGLRDGRSEQEREQEREIREGERISHTAQPKLEQERVKGRERERRDCSFLTELSMSISSFLSVGRGKGLRNGRHFPTDPLLICGKNLSASKAMEWEVEAEEEEEEEKRTTQKLCASQSLIANTSQRISVDREERERERAKSFGFGLVRLGSVRFGLACK